MSKIAPSLWFIDKAEEAAAFYVSLFADSRVDRVIDIPDSPRSPSKSVKLVDFTLAGQQFTAMNAGPLDPFNHAISLTVNCDDQAEVDRLWDALSQGGSIEQCGWLKDRYGVSWQVVPTVLIDMLADPDRAKAARVTEAMLGMVKLDIDGFRRAFDGSPPM